MMAKTAPNTIDDMLHIVRQEHIDFKGWPALRKRDKKRWLNRPEILGNKYRGDERLTVVCDSVISLGQEQKVLQLLRLEVLIFIQRFVGEPKRDFKNGVYGRTHIVPTVVPEFCLFEGRLLPNSQSLLPTL